jgi:hypothetical protein
MANKIYLLKIFGTISSAKQKEFEQTIRFAVNLLPSSCISSHLSMDVFNSNTYHFFTLWRSPADMAAFRRSNEFDLIRGAFQALGFLDRSFVGELIDEQVYDESHDP